MSVFNGLVHFDVPAVYNTVTFENTGRTWRFINEDFINLQRTSTNYLVYDMLQDRLNKNMYEYIIGEGPSNRKWGDIELSAAEIKLIYNLDPHGLAAYVQAHANRMVRYLDNTSEEKNRIRINYKNHVYRLLFNKEPGYYIRNDITSAWDKVREEDITSMSPQEYLSESELLFGRHPVYDTTTALAFVNVILVIVESIFKLPNLSKLENIKKGIELVHKAYNMSVTVCKAIFEEKLAECVAKLADDYANGKVIKWLDLDETFDCVTQPLSWVTACYKIGNALGDLAETFASSPIYLKPLLDYSVTNPDYSICIQFVNDDSTSVTYRLDTIQDAVEALRNGN